MELDFAERHYAIIWENYLSRNWDENIPLVEDCLEKLARVSTDRKLADDWINEADFSYILGAMKKNDHIHLKHAIHSYNNHLVFHPHNVKARRLLMETHLRLHEYDEAWEEVSALVEIDRNRLLNTTFGKDVDKPDEEVSYFSLTHYLDWLKYIQEKGVILPAEVQKQVESLECGRDLLPKDNSIISCKSDSKISWKDICAGLSSYNRINVELPLVRTPECRILSLHDWDDISNQYFDEKLVVLDHFFTDQAIHALREWSLMYAGEIFQTIRNGYLGAFPGDGANHPIIMKTAFELEGAMPDVFAGHPLGLWWLFKYCGVGDSKPSGSEQRGIGLHADPAAVNINVWLTPPSEESIGGGLRVFKYVPPVEGHIQQYNHEFKSIQEELDFREHLEKQGGSRSVDYAFNRAILFVSDQYHHSEKFSFPSEFDQQRMNLTMLFGDRQEQETSSADNNGIEQVIKSVPVPQCDLKEDWDIFN